MTTQLRIWYAGLYLLAPASRDCLLWLLQRSPPSDRRREASERLDAKKEGSPHRWRLPTAQTPP